MTPDARAARERKQKIFVAVGGVALLALLAFQLPRLLGGSGGSEAALTTTTATGPVAQAQATATQANAAQGATSPRATAAPVALAAGTYPVASVSDKLSSFGSFKRKDPFVQQVTAADLTATGGSTAAKPSGAKQPAKPASVSKKFSLTTKTAAVPALTVISVNGERQALQTGARFPSSDPVFVLVAEHPESKSVVVGVVGGAYSGGSETAKLVQGKPVSLVNTTTGARYRIVLVAVGSGAASDGGGAKSPAKHSSATSK